MHHIRNTHYRAYLCFCLIFCAGGSQAAQSPCSGTHDPSPSLTLSWDPVIGGVSYAAEITTDPNFGIGIFSVSAGGSLSTQVSTLLHGTTYYWRVRTNRAQSWETPNYTFGTVCSFSTSVATQVPQSAPSYYNPFHNSVDIADYQQLSWNAIGGATSYQVQLSTDPAMVTGITTFPETSNWSVEAYPLAVGTTYYWRVRARNGVGWASWTLSPIQRFDTRSAPTPMTVKAFLQGPLVTTPTVSMTDGLRSGGYLPTTEPYTFGPTYFNLANGFASVSAGLFGVTGTLAIVDWVIVQARHGSTNEPIKAWAMVVRRDGVVALPDGGGGYTVNPTITFPMKNMKFSVHHRNHLAAMTANAVNATGTTLNIDFTSTSTVLHGTNPTYVSGSVRALWAGDCSGNGTILYTGSGNDRDLVLSAIGGVVPTNTVTGYLPADLNMDGSVKYTGVGNDRDIILSTIGGVVPTNSRVQQLP